jgi:hypothetical protein
LREALVALFGRDVRRHGAAGERLEPQQQPIGIVGDVEHEVAVGGQRQGDSCPLRFVREWRRRQHHRQEHES